MKKLIVNADDFGQSSGINKGIIKAHEEGIVTSASLMVRYPAAIEAAEYAKKNNSLGVGLHLDFGEWILSDGEWKSIYEVVDLEDEEAVRQEVKNQIDAFYKILGRKPTHIDSHQHVHQRDGVLPIVFEAGRSLNIVVRNSGPLVKYSGDFYGQNIDGSPNREAISVEGLKKTILALNDGTTEMACHPGLNDDVETMYRDERVIEVATLCDTEISELINKENIILCSFQGINNTMSKIKE